MSLPSRERGLKFTELGRRVKAGVVAPFTGAWIEMTWTRLSPTMWTVAPFTGAWIEIVDSWCVAARIAVAPFTGAWIEICAIDPVYVPTSSRSLHGSVD